MRNLIPTRYAVAREVTTGGRRVKLSSEILVKVSWIRTSTRAYFTSYIASEERIIKPTNVSIVKLNIINTLSKNGAVGGKSSRKPSPCTSRSVFDDQCMPQTLEAGAPTWWKSFILWVDLNISSYFRRGAPFNKTSSSRSQASEGRKIKPTSEGYKILMSPSQNSKTKTHGNFIPYHLWSFLGKTSSTSTNVKLRLRFDIQLMFTLTPEIRWPSSDHPLTLTKPWIGDFKLHLNFTCCSQASKDDEYN